MAVPILPPSWGSWPARLRRCAMSAVVVDLPLVPVMATNGASGACRRRSRQNNSMSPITSTPASRAISTLQCGLGWVSGAPGVSTSAAKLAQEALRKSMVTKWARAASANLSAPSSPAKTLAPPALSAWQLARPDPPRPNTATLLPAKEVTGIMIVCSPQLERGEAGQRQHHRDDPEPDHDLRLGPAQLLEMMMDRRHLEDALARELEGRNLHDHRNRFQHEQSADHGQHDLVLDGDRDRTEHAAERERAGVAHEDRGRRRVEPEKSEARAEQRAAQHRELAGARDIVDLQIVGEDHVAGEIGDQAKACGCNHDRDDCEPVETVGQIDGIAGADNDESAEDHEEPAEIQHYILEERDRKRRRRRVAAEPDQRVAGGERDHRFQRQAEAAGKAAGGLFRHLQIIVIEADEAEAERHREHDPDIGVERVGPQQGRDHEPRQDHQPAHGGRALLGEMRLRAVGADRLALALPDPQMVDDPGAEQEDEQGPRYHRAAGTECDVAENIQKRAKRGEAGKGV